MAIRGWARTKLIEGGPGSDGRGLAAVTWPSVSFVKERWAYHILPHFIHMVAHEAPMIPMKTSRAEITTATF